jgi:transposase-like protein
VPAPRKFDEETRVRAVRLYRDRLRDHGESKLAARTYVGRLLGINPATLRNWVERERGRRRPGRDAGWRGIGGGGTAPVA